MKLVWSGVFLKRYAITIFGIGVLLQLQRDPHVVGRDVLDVEERRQLARQHDLGDPLDERGLVHRVGDAGDVDRLAAARVGGPSSQVARRRMVPEPVL